MKWITLLYLLFLFPVYIFAQQENVWISSDGTGLNFNTVPPTAINAGSAGGQEAVASVCDRYGQLLFYTDGSFVWDRNYNLMPNGYALTGLGIGSSTISSVTSSTTQGALIVPVPDDTGKYYIFSLTQIEMGANAGRLYYSIVDMSLHNGLGDILPGQKGISVDSGLTEKLTGVVGKHCDVWVLTHSTSSNTFRAYEITSSGISIHPVLSNTGILNYHYHLVGELQPSSDHKKIVCAESSLSGGGLELFDFDGATGNLSNSLVIDSFPNGYGYYSACFSPDHSKVYATDYKPAGISYLYQFDLNDPNPAATKLLLDSVFSMSKVKLAHDGKIYYRDYLGHLGIISKPNAAGMACGLIHNTLINISAGLPNVVPIFTHDTAVYTSVFLQAPCWSSDYVLHADTSGWDYLWDNNITNSMRIITVPGTYWVSYTGSPCTYHVDTFVVSFPNGVLPQLGISSSCRNDTNGKAWAYTYPEDTVTYHYTWTDTSNHILSTTDTLENVPSGHYKLMVTAGQCDTVLSLFIPEEDHLVSFLADTLVCEQDVMQFQNTSDRYYTQFYWNFGDSTVSALESPTHIYEQPGSYSVLFAASGGQCRDTAFKTITVDPRLSGSFTLAPDSICIGQAVTLYLETDSTIQRQSWAFGDGTEMSTTDPHRLQHAYDLSGILPVKLNTHFRACPDTSFTDTVYVYDLPKVDLGPDTSLCLNASPIILQNRQMRSPGAYHYRWNNGDTTESLKIVHPGIYNLTLSKEPLNCSSSATIKITKDCYMDIPNAFTPNGDGENDYFFPRQLLSQKITAFKMQIFNRWGQLLFETTKPDGRGWDGKLNGKPQPEGVYIYLIDAEINRTKTEHYQGNVTLIR